MIDSPSIMDCFNTCEFVEDWWANNEGRANGLSMQIQKITDEYLEIGIDGNVLQLTIPHSFSMSSSADGIISSADCAFVVTLTEGKDESSSTGSVQDLLIALNEKLERLSSHGNYSFGSVLDSVLDTVEEYKNCSDCEATAFEIYDDEDAGTINEGYSTVPGEGFSTATSAVSAPNQPLHFRQLVEDANGTCDRARLMVMSARVDVPCKVNEKDHILGRCRLYFPSHRVCCVRFEIELSGILSDQYRHRHGHVFEALGFSFATPLLIEVKFDSWTMNSKITSCGQSLGHALQGVSAWHEGVEFKVSHNERKFDYDEALPGELYEQIRKVIDNTQVDPVHFYGLRFLLPRMAKDFFTRGGKDPDNDNNVLLACEDNILVRFLLFIGSRLNSLLKRCIVCNKELPFTVSKLCSCTDELCLFGFEVLGWGAQVLQEVIRKPVELIDLEISLALAATDECLDVFEPFPPFLLKDREIRHRSGFFNNENSSGSQPRKSDIHNKNMDVLRSIISSFPPVSEMRLCGDEIELKEKLANSWLSTAEGKSVEEWDDKYFGKEVWQLPYNVLRFILCTNRLSLVFISEDDGKLVKDDKTHPHWKCYQFAVVHDSPEKEAYLESLRTTKVPGGIHGSRPWYSNILKRNEPWYSNILKRHKSSRTKPQCSTFLFHGSNGENWYSILRNGLRCLSSTDLMRRGNTSGDGIYMSKYFNVSANYGFVPNGVSAVSGWKNGLYKDGFYVVSICELISCPVENYQLQKSMVPKEYEGSVAVRYLLVTTCTRKHQYYAEFFKCQCSLGAYITDGQTWHHSRSTKIKLHQHYQRLRQKYLSSSS